MSQRIHEGGGSEHDILLNSARDKWWKINFLAFHADPLEFMSRIVLHNFLFGEYAPIKFEGVAVRIQ